MKITVILLLTSLLAFVRAGIQELTLHESLVDNRGNSHIFRAQVPDTSVFPLGSVLRACASPGSVWRFYNHPNYTGVTSHVRLNPCSNNVSSITGSKSFRFLANLSTEVDAISLYPQRGFQGEEIYVGHSPFGGITTRIQSMARTGTSAWTIFEGPNFEGKSVCLPPLNGLQTESPFDISYSYNMTTVGSLVKGCLTSVTAELRKSLLRNATYL